MILYQGGTIYHDKYVSVPVSQSSAESEYNAACTAGMTLAYLRMLIHEFFNMDPDIVPDEVPLIVLYSKSAMCMEKNGKDTKYKRHMARIIHFVRNGEK